ncbi:hypothetical protein GCM10022221_35410 [Actinocorallia aurea]
MILTYSLRGGQFGGVHESRNVRARARRIGDLLAEAGAGEFDGDEFGDAEVSLYFYGPDADLLFSIAKDQLKSIPYRPASIELRYGSPDDKHAQESATVLDLDTI